jgi:hypothetical protein
MNEMNLLVNSYYPEQNEEGLATLRRLVSSANDVQLVVFAQGSMQKATKKDVDVRISAQFNLIEGSLVVRQDGTGTRRLDIRYRPAVSSKTWENINLPSERDFLRDATSRVRSPKEVEDYQLLLSLKSFESASRREKTDFMAVFEICHHSIESADSAEVVILNSFRNTCPEMLRREIWGHASFIPFRTLSVGEEWEAAAGMIFWSDLTVLKGVQHQYLFVSQSASPKLTRPSDGTRVGELTIYRLPF